MMKRLPFALFRYCQSYDLRIEPKDIADVHGKAHIPAARVNFVQKKTTISSNYHLKHKIKYLQDSTAT